MSNQFYSFLAEEILGFFKENVKPGIKYNIQFETQKQVDAMYGALQNNIYVRAFSFINAGQAVYSSYQLEFPNGISLIVSATSDAVHPDFLNTLRNFVGKEKGYEDKAIFFIHNSSLDSLIGGTESFLKEGMPFHIDTIQAKIKQKMLTNIQTEVDREIIQLDLDRKKENIFNDNTSLFEYEEVLDILSKGYVAQEQYRDFGLFYDKDLGNATGADLRKQLKQNAFEYNRIDNIHNYGNPDKDLEKYYDEKGYAKLKSEDWKDTFYKEVKKYAEDNKNKPQLEYQAGSMDWDKEEGITKAKIRIRNILIFNQFLNEEIQLELPFSDFLKNDGIDQKKVLGTLEVKAAGKKLQLKLKVDTEQTNFYYVPYKMDSTKFEFKIAVIHASPQYFDGIKAKYTLVIKKKKSYLKIVTNDSKIVFNEYESEDSIRELEYNNELIQLLPDRRIILQISDNFDYANDSELITFNLQVNNRTIPVAMEGSQEKIPPIDGFKVWKLKREKATDFKMNQDMKLTHGTKEYFIRDEFRKSLTLEKELIELNGISFVETADGIEVNDIALDLAIKNAYQKILYYFRDKNKLPSLTHLDGELNQLYSDFMSNYLKGLNQLQEGDNLSRTQLNLLKLGTLKREVGDREIIMTPLHPLNIAYQLHLNNLLGTEAISEDILRKFTSTYLVPFLLQENEHLFNPMEQHHSPEYTYYVDENLPRYKSSREFVSKLVTDKIEEFIGHFKYLFDMGHYAPLKLNLINTGDSKEILQGVFKYYLKQLRNDKLSEVLPIDLYIYADKNITNAFEEVAFNDNIKTLKEMYDLDFTNDSMSEEDVLNLYREKVRFYSKQNGEAIEYAHITFLEMVNEIKKTTSNMSNISTGVVLNGLISGVPSAFLGESYRTGFGLKHAPKDNQLVETAGLLNALNASNAGAMFKKDGTQVIQIPLEHQLDLDKIYNASHWVTFIDPKVDLNFFKNDPNATDLLIIHYSDQYTTAGGYDAITVTRKSEPYQKVIEEFLESKGVERPKIFTPAIINMFNAVNGDWLLGLLSNKSHSPKEKISILSAIKVVLAKFENPSVTWVPISLEEILRISGGAGLKQSEGFLSAKNLEFEKGSASDDILLVGIEPVGEEVKVHLYPMEVKIGVNDSSVIKKGIDQAKTTKREFERIFFPDENGQISETKRVHRNFLMQLVIASAEKFDLYHVCPEQNWKSVTQTRIREKLLNESYQFSRNFEDVLKKALVMSFKNGVVSEAYYIDSDVSVFELTEMDGINLVTKEIPEIQTHVGNIKLPIESHEHLVSHLLESESTSDDGAGMAEWKESIQVEMPATKNSPGEEIIDDCVDMPLIQEIIAELPERNMEILFGQNIKSGKQILWKPNDTNKVFHTNTGIIGTMGTGKTQFTKSMITQIYREAKYNVDGKDIGILIFDYKGDYNTRQTDFIKATDAKVYQLYNLPFNPLTIVQTDHFKPMLPLHIANSLKVTLAKSFGLGMVQENLLRDFIMEAYKRKGILPQNPATWSNPAPTLQDVFEVYSEQDTRKDSLYAAFSNLIAFSIFEADTNKTVGLFEMLDGVTVIDLAGYDVDQQNLVVAIILDLFYSQMQAYGHSGINGNLRQLNKIILVDEADNFLSKDFETLKKILKEGREFGVGTILSTQLLSHFSTGENKYSDYILTWIVHNVAEITTKDVNYIFNQHQKADQERTIQEIKSLKKHHSLVKLGDVERPIAMKDLAFWELI